MDELSSVLLGFLSVAFLIETIIIIGVFFPRNLNIKYKRDNSILEKFQQLMEKWDTEGPRWKKMGELYMAIGALAMAIEVVSFIWTYDFSIWIGDGYIRFFNMTSPGITISGLGLAIYAFGVNLVDNQTIKNNLEASKNRIKKS